MAHSTHKHIELFLLERETVISCFFRTQCTCWDRSKCLLSLMSKLCAYQNFRLDYFLVWLFILRKGLTYPKLASNLVYIQRWPWPLDPLGPASWMLGLQVCGKHTTVPALYCFASMQCWGQTLRFICSRRAFYQLSYIPAQSLNMSLSFFEVFLSCIQLAPHYQ